MVHDQLYQGCRSVPVIRLCTCGDCRSWGSTCVHCWRRPVGGDHGRGRRKTSEIHLIAATRDAAKHWIIKTEYLSVLELSKVKIRPFEIHPFGFWTNCACSLAEPPTLSSRSPIRATARHTLVATDRRCAEMIDRHCSESQLLLRHAKARHAVVLTKRARSFEHAGAASL